MESIHYLTKWLRASIDSLHVFGLAVGVLFFAASLTPSLLPRPTWIQGVLSGVVLSVGYGLGVLGVWIWKYLQFPMALGHLYRASDIVATLPACVPIGV
jgi:uncharacterized membrane protein